MSSALEGPERRTVTLAEQANSSRLRRSTFIGHSAGYLVIFALVAAGLAFAGFTRPVSYDAVFAAGEPPLVLHLPYTGLHPYATLALAVIAAIVWTDLTVRRRHDRGRSGTGAVIWQMLFVASVILHGFAEAPDIVGWLDALLVLGGAYLFVVLALLPGTRGANRYGPPPELD
jgi:uncharacterized membrane protein YhaH (DUF805 family)